MEGIGAFRVFMKARLNIEPYSLLKQPRLVLFSLANSLSRAENLASVKQVTQAVVRFGLLRLGRV